MEIIGKILRQLVKVRTKIRLRLRKLHLKATYDCNIDNKTTIGQNCKIISTVGSSLTIINSQIDDGVKIIADHGGQIVIKDSYIGTNSVIIARNNIKISSNCQIAEMVVIRDQNHKFGAEGKTIAEQGFETAPIIISENVWIGAKASVLMGTTIEENTIVGAHSLAKGLLEKNSVYVGTPARKIKSF